jgi:hypothetical protein
MPPGIGPGVVIERSPLPTFIPAFAVQSGEGLTVQTPTGDSVTVKADTRKTNGSLIVLELLIGPKQGPRCTPTFARTSCGMSSKVTSASRRATPCSGRRRAAWHSGRVARRTASRTSATRQGRLLVITTPSGLERFFEQFAQLLPGPVDPEKLAAVGRASWVEFVGPPVGASDPL